jgi:hypothetical protein
VILVDHRLDLARSSLAGVAGFVSPIPAAAVVPPMLLPVEFPATLLTMAMVMTPIKVAVLVAVPASEFVIPFLLLVLMMAAVG